MKTLNQNLKFNSTCKTISVLLRQNFTFFTSFYTKITIKTSCRHFHNFPNFTIFHFFLHKNHHVVQMSRCPYFLYNFIDLGHMGHLGHSSDIVILTIIPALLNSHIPSHKSSQFTFFTSFYTKITIKTSTPTDVFIPNFTIFTPFYTKITMLFKCPVVPIFCITS